MRVAGGGAGLDEDAVRVVPELAMRLQVVDHNERVQPLPTPELGDGAARRRRHDALAELLLRRVRRHHRRVLHGPCGSQPLHNLLMLAACAHVDAPHPFFSLVDDGVDNYVQSAQVIISDEEHVLTSADRRKCIDGRKASVKWLANGSQILLES